MRCRRARAIIARAIDDRWTLDERFALEEHVARCRACERELARLGRVDEALQRRPEPPLDRLDVERAVRAIGARLDEAERAGGARPSRSRSLSTRAAGIVTVIGLAAAAVVVVVLGTSDPIHDSIHDPSPRAGTSPRGLATASPRERRSDLALERGPDAPRAEPMRAAQPAPETAPVRGPDELDPVDPERLLAMRTRIRERLATLGAELEPAATSAEAETFVQRFETSVAAWSAEGWPIARLVTGALDDESSLVRRAAARFLGLRGDRLGLAALERRLDRLDEQGDPSFDLPCALLDAAERGIDVLPELIERVELVDWLATHARDRERVADLVGRRLGAGAGARFERAWWAALPKLGAAGRRALVDVGVRHPERRDAALAALERDPDTAAARAVVGSELARLDRSSPDWAFALCARLRPAGTADWLARRLADGSGRERELELLLDLEGPRALECALELWDDGRLGFGAVPPVLVERVERAPRELVAIANERIAAGWFDRGAARRVDALADFAIAADAPAATGVLLACVRSPLVAPPTRLASVNAIAELPHDPIVADELVTIARTLDRDRADLAAALLVALWQDRDFARLRAALPRASKVQLAALERELTLYDAERRTASLVRIARSIEPWLGERSTSRRTRP